MALAGGPRNLRWLKGALLAVNTELFFPLRSNAWWFGSADARERLEGRIKNALILYDRLLFQDGRYHFRVTDTGSHDFLLPPVMLGDERKVIRYKKPGDQVGIALSTDPSSPEKTVLFGGAAVMAAEVDYFPILEDAGIRE